MPELTLMQYAKKQYGLKYFRNIRLEELEKLGYESVGIGKVFPYFQYKIGLAYINKTFGDNYAIFTGNKFWFRTKEDAVMFKLGV